MVPLDIKKIFEQFVDMLFLVEACVLFFLCDFSYEFAYLFVLMVIIQKKCTAAFVFRMFK